MKKPLPQALTAKDYGKLRTLIQYEVKPLKDEVKRLRKVLEGKTKQVKE